MDVRGNVGQLTRAIADSEIQSLLDEATGVFRQQAAELIEQFAGDPPTAPKTNDLENNLHEQLRQLGRRLIQAIFSLLQPEPEEMPGTVSFRGDSHRRLQGTTTRRDILTRFGKVSLTRARYRRGRRGRTIFPLEMLLGTVFLGRVPETNQVTLSGELTDLLKATVRRCGDRAAEIVYVSDAGKVETAYWRNTLSKFFVDGQLIKITRVVDYYHAAERLTTIADALKFGKDKAKRKEWLEHARWLLLQPGGHGRMLCSIAAMRRLCGYKRSACDDAETAERYLRRYHRFMDYAGMKARGYPIGSGVVESAWKQIVSERMKLSGMRWKKEGGQHTMTLR